MDFIKLTFRYFKYFFSSKDEHSLHSPFLFNLYTNIIKAKTKEPNYTAIEKQRQQLFQNNTQIEIEDFGAGSKIHKSNFRTVSQIAKNAQKPAKFGRLLFRLVSNFKSKTVIDLGTSLGITTSYLALANNSSSKIYSFEGCNETSKIAKDTFKALNINNVILNIGNIDNLLPEVLTKIDIVDFVFFDANHRFEPTLRYFELCLDKANENSIFVFDDIHWSVEMENAWASIKDNEKVMVTIDLFYVGIVFFRKNAPKQEFVLKF